MQSNKEFGFSEAQDTEAFCLKEQFRGEWETEKRWRCLTEEESKHYCKRMLIDLKETQGEQFQIEMHVHANKDFRNEIPKKVDYLEQCLIKFRNNTLGISLRDIFEAFVNSFSLYAKILGSKTISKIRNSNEETIWRFFVYFLNQGYQELIQESKKSISFGLDKDIQLNSKEDALKILVKMGQEANMNFVVVIDAAYFIKLGIMRDEAIAEEITMVYEKAIQNDSCLIIFDLGSIADVMKEFNELNEETSITSDKATSITSDKAFKEGKNDALFTYTINRKQAFRATLECLELGSNSTKNHWLVALSDNNKLTLDFKEKLKWPPSEQQMLREQNILARNDSRRCVYCLEFFTEKINEPNACGRHLSEFLYDQGFITKITAIKKNEQNRLLPYDPFKDPNLPKKLYSAKAEEIRDMMESGDGILIRKASNYVWYCCGKKLYEKGECKAKHSAQFDE